METSCASLSKSASGAETRVLHTWPAPGGSGELALQFDIPHAPRLLILPAWFDEGNKTRHFTVETMRILAADGIASILPDLPGCNESAASLYRQDIDTWREAAAAAALHFDCSHVLAIRAASCIAPSLPGFAYAPLAGSSVLRALLRARVIVAKEAGRSETREALLECGLREGLELAGYRLGPSMIAQLAEAESSGDRDLMQIAQSDVGKAGLWLRAEPAHDPEQARSLARIVAQGLVR